MNRSLRHVLFAALLLTVPFLTYAAAIVYDNSSNDLNFDLDPGTSEVGDEIMLAGTERWLSEFTFEYWGSADDPLAFTGSVEARIRFYLNDGPAYPDAENAFLPGTVIWDTGTFAITPTERATLTFTDFVVGTTVPLTGPLPDSLTWTVQFSGFGANDAAGVTIYSPPTVGNNFDDYWVNDGVAWTLQTNIIAMDFAARLSAELIPEPSAMSPRPLRWSARVRGPKPNAKSLRLYRSPKSGIEGQVRRSTLVPVIARVTVKQVTAELMEPRHHDEPVTLCGHHDEPVTL
jgi:hypothetical protein